MRGGDELAAAVATRLQRMTSAAESVLQEGVVTQTAPGIVIELTDSRIELHDDEFVLSQDVEVRRSTIAVGDNVVVMRKNSSGEMRWVVIALLSDNSAIAALLALNPPGSIAAISMDPWHLVGGGGSEPAFQNSWANRYGASEAQVAFRKDPAGQVYLKGDMTGGASTTVAFQLPPGYWPSENLRLNPYNDGTAGNATVYVRSDGAVAIFFNGTGVSLAGLDFQSAGSNTWPVGTMPPIPVVTSLPAGVNGQEVYFQTMAMATAGIPPWHLRYRSLNPDGSPNTSAYKWEVVGDPAPLYNRWSGGSAATTSGGFTFIPVAGGTSVALPLAGDYMVEYGASVQNTSTSFQDVNVAVFNASNSQLTNSVDAYGRMLAQVFQKEVINTQSRINGLTATTIDVRGIVTGGGTCDYNGAYIIAKPIRVG